MSPSEHFQPFFTFTKHGIKLGKVRRRDPVRKFGLVFGKGIGPWHWPLVNHTVGVRSGVTFKTACASMPGRLGS